MELISGEILPDKSCKILLVPSQKFMQDLSDMISQDIVPNSVAILHARPCKIIVSIISRSCKKFFLGKQKQFARKDLGSLGNHQFVTRPF